MSAILIDGNATAELIKKELAVKLADLQKKGCRPHLSVVLVGEDPASKVYVAMKQKDCEKLGIGSETIHLDQSVREGELLDLLRKLNNNIYIHGILVQLPLPKHIDSSKVLESISPAKDVDGFHPINRGKLVLGEDCLLPCTPAGIQQLLIKNGHEIAGKHVVVVGRSSIVGMPFALMMMQKKEGANATVTICHTGTKDIKKHTLQADILVVASGRPKTVTGDMINHGCVVVDVGVNRVDDSSSARGYRLEGDVDFESAKKVATAITPVPGGVGPMTRVMLLNNTLAAAEAQFAN